MITKNKFINILIRTDSYIDCSASPDSNYSQQFQIRLVKKGSEQLSKAYCMTVSLYFVQRHLLKNILENLLNLCFTILGHLTASSLLKFYFLKYNDLSLIFITAGPFRTQKPCSSSAIRRIDSISRNASRSTHFFQTTGSFENIPTYIYSHTKDAINL